MRKEFTDEDRALTTDQTDLRYWPEETQHQAVRKLIPKLGYLARGFDDVAVVDGPIGTEMVTLPGVLTPLEWDPKRLVLLLFLSLSVCWGRRLSVCCLVVVMRVSDVELTCLKLNVCVKLYVVVTKVE